MDTVYFFSPNAPNLSFGLTCEGSRHQVRFKSGILEVNDESLVKEVEKVAPRIGIRRLSAEEMEAIRGEKLPSGPRVAQGVFHTLSARGPLPGLHPNDPGAALSLFAQQKAEQTT